MAPSDQSIVCPGCTCLCDDVLIESADSLSVINACERGVAWIEEGIANADQPVTHRLNGKTADLESVTAAAADRLLAANAPLICGLDKLDT